MPPVLAQCIARYSADFDRQTRMSYFWLLRPVPAQRNFRIARVICGAAAESRTQKIDADVLVYDEGKRLQVSWDGGRTSPSSSRSVFHSVWLRRNCHCSQCLSLYNQNVVRSHEMDPRVAIVHANLTGSLW